MNTSSTLKHIHSRGPVEGFEAGWQNPNSWSHHEHGNEVVVSRCGQIYASSHEQKYRGRLEAGSPRGPGRGTTSLVSVLHAATIAVWTTAGHIFGIVLYSLI